MDTFVARENIRHFHDRLETESDPTTRSLLHRLLVQEEDKLGYDSEALREIDSHIAGAKEHVNRLQAVVASIERNGRDAAQAVALLNAYTQTLLAFQSHRERISIRLQRSRL